MEWIRVEDALPENGQKLVVIYQPSELFGCCEYQAPAVGEDKRLGVWLDLIAPDDPYFYQQRISHWIPLPELPK